MANRANDYPSHVACPLRSGAIIDAGDCVETQAVADNMFVDNGFEKEFAHLGDWKRICQNCKYFECD